MDKLQPFIDAYLKGDELFRFVYKPDTDELFLEDDLEEQDNGKFLYIPVKNSREYYMEMAYFTDEQPEIIREVLLDALSSPSPIEKFERIITPSDYAEAWQERKSAYAKKHIYQWFVEQGLHIE